MAATTTRTEPTTTLAGRRIQPPFTLYTLSAEAGMMNSPAVPCVRIVEEEMGPRGSFRYLKEHALTPTQARALAADLIAAADRFTR